MRYIVKLNYVLFFMVLSFNSTSDIPDPGPKRIGGDLDDRIIAIFEGLERSSDGKLATLRVKLKNISDSSHGLYIEIEQLHRGGIVLQNESGFLESYLDDYPRNDNRQTPSELLVLEPGDTIDYSYEFSDYFNFDSLSEVDEVTVYLAAIIFMFDAGADFRNSEPTGVVYIFHSISNVIFQVKEAR